MAYTIIVNPSYTTYGQKVTYAGDEYTVGTNAFSSLAWGLAQLGENEGSIGITADLVEPTGIDISDKISVELVKEYDLTLKASENNGTITVLGGGSIFSTAWNEPTEETVNNEVITVPGYYDALTNDGEIHVYTAGNSTINGQFVGDGKFVFHGVKGYSTDGAIKAIIQGEEGVSNSILFKADTGKVVTKVANSSIYVSAIDAEEGAKIRFTDTELTVEGTADFSDAAAVQIFGTNNVLEIGNLDGNIQLANTTVTLRIDGAEDGAMVKSVGASYTATFVGDNVINATYSHNGTTCVAAVASFEAKEIANTGKSFTVLGDGEDTTVTNLNVGKLAGTITLADGAALAASSIDEDGGNAKILVGYTSAAAEDPTADPATTFTNYTADVVSFSGENDFAANLYVNGGTANVSGELAVATLTTVKPVGVNHVTFTPVYEEEEITGYTKKSTALTGTVNVGVGASLTATSITNAGKIDVKAKAAGFNAGNITNTGALTFGKLAADSEGNVGTVVAGDISYDETTAIGSVSFSSSKASVGNIKNQKSVTFTAADVAANEISGNTTVTVGKGESKLNVTTLNNAVTMSDGAVLKDSTVSAAGENGILFVGATVVGGTAHSKTQESPNLSDLDDVAVKYYKGNVVGFNGENHFASDLSIGGGTANITGKLYVDDITNGNSEAPYYKTVTFKKVVDKVVSGQTIYKAVIDTAKSTLNTGLINIADETEAGALLNADAVTNAAAIKVGTAAQKGSLEATSLQNNGAVTVDAKGNLNVATVTNTKTLSLNGTATVATSLENSGTVSIAATTGSLTAGAITNSNGAFNVNGTLTADSFANSKAFTVGATNATVVGSATLGTLTNNAGGTVSVNVNVKYNGKANLSVTNNVTNNGTINANGTMTAGSITNGTAAIPDNLETTEDKAVAAVNGTITVSGDLTATTINNIAGTITVNKGTGTLTAGTINNAAAFTVDSEANGENAGTLIADEIINSGTLKLAGVLGALDDLSTEDVNEAKKLTITNNDGEVTLARLTDMKNVVFNGGAFAVTPSYGAFYQNLTLKNGATLSVTTLNADASDASITIDASVGITLDGQGITGGTIFFDEDAFVATKDINYTLVSGDVSKAHLYVKDREGEVTDNTTVTIGETNYTLVKRNDSITLTTQTQSDVYVNTAWTDEKYKPGYEFEWEVSEGTTVSLTYGLNAFNSFKGVIDDYSASMGTIHFLRDTENNGSADLYFTVESNLVLDSDAAATQYFDLHHNNTANPPKKVYDAFIFQTTQEHVPAGKRVTVTIGENVTLKTEGNTLYCGYNESPNFVINGKLDTVGESAKGSIWFGEASAGRNGNNAMTDSPVVEVSSTGRLNGGQFVMHDRVDVTVNGAAEGATDPVRLEENQIQTTKATIYSGTLTLNNTTMASSEYVWLDNAYAYTGSADYINPIDSSTGLPKGSRTYDGAFAVLDNSAWTATGALTVNGVNGTNGTTPKHPEFVTGTAKLTLKNKSIFTSTSTAESKVVGENASIVLLSDSTVSLAGKLTNSGSISASGESDIIVGAELYNSATIATSITLNVAAAEEPRNVMVTFTQGDVVKSKQVEIAASETATAVTLLIEPDFLAAGEYSVKLIDGETETALDPLTVKSASITLNKSTLSFSKSNWSSNYGTIKALDGSVVEGELNQYGTLTINASTLISNGLDMSDSATTTVTGAGNTLEITRLRGNIDLENATLTDSIIKGTDADKPGKLTIAAGKTGTFSGALDANVSLENNGTASFAATAEADKTQKIGAVTNYGTMKVSTYKSQKSNRLTVASIVNGKVDTYHKEGNKDVSNNDGVVGTLNVTGKMTVTGTIDNVSKDGNNKSKITVSKELKAQGAINNGDGTNGAEILVNGGGTLDASGQTITNKKNSAITVDGGTLKAGTLTTNADNAVFTVKGTSTVEISNLTGTLNLNGTLNNSTVNKGTGSSPKIVIAATQSGTFTGTLTSDVALENSGTASFSGDDKAQSIGNVTNKGELTVSGSAKTTGTVINKREMGAVTNYGTMNVSVTDNGLTVDSIVNGKADTYKNGKSNNDGFVGTLNVTGKMTVTGTIDNVGKASNAKSTITINGNLKSTGTINNTNGIINGTGKLEASGTINNNAGGEISGIALTKNGDTYATVENQGSFTANKNVHVKAFNNTGTLIVSTSGTDKLAVDETLANGSATAKGTVTINTGATVTAAIITNSGKDSNTVSTITVDGTLTTTGKFDNNAWGSLIVNNTATIGGTFTNKENASLTIYGTVTADTFTNNDGASLTVKAKSDKSVTMSVTGEFKNTGSLTIDASAITLGDGELLKVIAAGSVSNSKAITVTGNTNVTAVEGADGIYLRGVGEKYDTTVIYVNTAWAGYKPGETVTFGQKELVFGSNAFADAEFALGPETVALVFAATNDTYKNLNLTGSNVAKITVAGAGAARFTSVTFDVNKPNVKAVNLSGQSVSVTGEAGTKLDGDVLDLSGTSQIALGTISGDGTIKASWDSKLSFSGFDAKVGGADTLIIDVSTYCGNGNTVVTDAKNTNNYGGAKVIGEDGEIAGGFEKYFTVSNNDLSMNTANRYVTYVSQTISGIGYDNQIEKSLVHGAEVIRVLDGTYGLTYFNANPAKVYIGKAGLTPVHFTSGVYGGELVNELGTLPYDKVEKTGNINLTVNSGSFDKIVAAGDRIQVTSTTKKQGFFVRTGNTNLTINGGTFTQYVVGGQVFQPTDSLSFAQITQTNLTINGGTFTNYIYGGSMAGNKAASGRTFVGSTNITINAGATAININAGLRVGSYGYGAVTGDTKLTLTGVGDNLYAKALWGGSGEDFWSIAKDETRTYEGFVSGSRILSFDGFTGTLNCGSIDDFSKVIVDAESSVTLLDAVNLDHVDNWDLSYGVISGTGENAVTSGLRGNFSANLSGDKMILDATGLGAQQTWQVIAAGAKLADYDKLQVSFDNGVHYVAYNDGWTSGNFKLEATYEGGMSLKNTAKLA